MVKFYNLVHLLKEVHSTDSKALLTLEFVVFWIVIDTDWFSYKCFMLPCIHLDSR